MKDKGIAPIIIVVIVVVAVAAAGAYVVVSGDGGGEGGAGEEGAGDGGTNGGTGGGTTENWEALDISSIDFTLDWSYSISGTDYDYTIRFRGRDLDTSTPDLRIDSTLHADTSSFVLNRDTKTGYVRPTQYADWTSFASSDVYYYSDEWSRWSSDLADYYNNHIKVDDLSWSGSYGGTSASYEVTNYDENPTIADSVFQPS